MDDIGSDREKRCGIRLDVDKHAGGSPKIVFMNLWKDDGALVRPNGMTRNSKEP